MSWSNGLTVIPVFSNRFLSLAAAHTASGPEQYFSLYRLRSFSEIRVRPEELPTAQAAIAVGAAAACTRIN